MTDEKEQTLEAAKQYLATDPAGRKGFSLFEIQKKTINFRNSDCASQAGKGADYFHRLFRRLGRRILAKRNQF